MTAFIEISAGQWRRLADVHRAALIADGTVELRFVNGERATVAETDWRTAIGDKSRPKKTARAA